MKKIIGSILIFTLLITSTLPIFAVENQMIPTAFSSTDTIQFKSENYNVHVTQNYIGKTFSKFSYKENGESFELIIDNQSNQYIINNRVYTEEQFQKAVEIQSDQLSKKVYVTPLNRLLAKYPSIKSSKNYTTNSLSRITLAPSNYGPTMEPPKSGYKPYMYTHTYKGPDYVKAITVTTVVALAGKALIAIGTAMSMLSALAAKIGTTTAFISGTIFGVYVGSFTLHYDHYQALHTTNPYAASNKIVMYVEVFKEGGGSTLQSTTEYSYFFHTRPF